MKDSAYAPKMLRERTSEELKGMLATLKHELFDLRIMHTTSQLKDTNKMRVTRQNIARVLTEMSRRAAAKRGGKKNG